MCSAPTVSFLRYVVKLVFSAPSSTQTGGRSRADFQGRLSSADKQAVLHVNFVRNGAIELLANANGRTQRPGTLRRKLL